MSYVKRMIANAQPWLAENPVGAVGLRFPGSSANRHMVIDRERFDRIVATADPDARAKLLDAERQWQETTGEIDQTHEKISSLLSQPLGEGVSSFRLADDAYGCMLSHWYVAWGRSGYNVFDLGQDFCAAMLLTDPDGLRLDDFRLPFAGLLITIPSGFAVGSFGRQFTKIHVTDWTDDAASCLRIDVTDGNEVVDCVISKESVAAGGVDAFGSLPPDDAFPEDDQRAAVTARQIAICALAFMQATPAATERQLDDERPTRRMRAVRSTPEPTPEPRRWVVGRTVRIDPNLVRAARSGLREAAFHVRHRFVVRGHWRAQACGPGWTERRRTWIAPFWKGPKDGAAIVHTYKPAGG